MDSKFQFSKQITTPKQEEKQFLNIINIIESPMHVAVIRHKNIWQVEMAIWIISPKFIWHSGCAVVACEKWCIIVINRKRITSKGISHPIRITNKTF